MTLDYVLGAIVDGRPACLSGLCPDPPREVLSRIARSNAL